MNGLTLPKTTIASSLDASSSLDAWDLVLKSSGIVMMVLLLLILFSLVSWYIIAYKFFYLRRAHVETTKFLVSFWNTNQLDDVYAFAGSLTRSPVAKLFRAGYSELGKIKAQASDRSEWSGDMQNIERALDRSRTYELAILESKIPFLATTGSTAPFVGLFGTVWGIMNSFRNIGIQKSASLATVAPGIAEALIATAIGLMAAIPAVVAYNYFTRKVKVQASEMETFSFDFLNIVKRNFFK